MLPQAQAQASKLLPQNTISFAPKLSPKQLPHPRVGRPALHLTGVCYCSIVVLTSKLISTEVSKAPSKHFKQYRYGMLQDSLGVKALGRSPCLKLNTVMWPFHPSTHCNRLVKQHEVKKKVVFLPVVLFIECHARKLN